MKSAQLSATSEKNRSLQPVGCLAVAVLAFATLIFPAAAQAEDVTTYSIGDPTDIEQLYVEMINRARANPQAEAQRFKTTTDSDVLGAYSYFGVNLTLMVSQFSTIPAVPPLSINEKLTAASRLHSLDMLMNNYQDHEGTDGSMPWDRGEAQGYDWSAYGENVYATVVSPFFGHAGLEVDWGGSTGGMQNPAGHRLNIHNSVFREIGVGVSLGTNGSVGPQVLTQDFGSPASPVPFITGVAYYDFNANGMYDAGEGIGGVTVTVSGANYNAVTSTSGGYSVPVPGNGSYTVTFTAPGSPTQQTPVTVTGGNNVKVDYVPTYTAPAISGTSALQVGQVGTYTFSTVGAATSYEYQVSTLSNYTLVEGAEKGAAGITASTSAGYTVIENNTVKNGANAFHLAHPQPVLQTLQLNHVLRVASGSTLTFWSRLGWAGSGQVAAAQISTDGGSAWKDVWTTAGTNGAGQTAFSQQSVSLSAYAGKDVSIRFAYRFSAGTYYPQTDAGVGFYIDDIAVSNAQESLGSSTAAAGNGSFQFSSQSVGTVSLAVRAILPGRILPWGPAKSVTIQAPQPTATLAVVANPVNGGTVSGGGVYVVGSAQQISAIPATGWSFTAWNDGNTQSARSVTVPSAGATYTATFAPTPVPSQIVLPVNGTVFTSGTVTFSWNAGVGVTSNALVIASTPTGTDILNKTVTGTSLTVTNIPVDGRPLYVTLKSVIKGQTKTATYTYTAFTAQSQMLTVNGVEQTSGNISTVVTTFGWSQGTNVTANKMTIGSKLNGTDIFNATVSGSTQTVNLPMDGRTIYVTLSSKVNNVWLAKNYTYIAPNIAAYSATMASVTSGTTVFKTDGVTLTGKSATFAWNAGWKTTKYSLSVGSTPGGTDVYTASLATTVLKQAVTVPVDGRTLYVTLSSMINGAWVSSSYTYTAFSAQAKLLTINGLVMTSGQLPAGTVTFAWSPAIGASAISGGSYLLRIGNTPGGTEYYNKQLAGTSAVVTNLPQDGRVLYVTLYSYVNSKWINMVYTCQAASAP